MQPGDGAGAGPGTTSRQDLIGPDNTDEAADATEQTFRRTCSRQASLPLLQRRSCSLSPLSIAALDLPTIMISQEDSTIVATPEPAIHSYFNDEDADVVVRSSDGVHFKVYKVILSKASPFYKDMFSLPQSPSEADDKPADFFEGIPILEQTENSRTLEHLFRFCYPCPNPDMRSLDDIDAVLEAANKYQLDDVALHARRSWNDLAALDPLRSFAIACSRGWVEEARSAALLSLREPVWPLKPPMAPEFRIISGDTVIRLMAYQRECGAAAKQAALNPERINRLFDASSCSHCSGSFTMTQTRRVRDWFTLYTRQVAPCLEKQPSGHTAAEHRLVDETIRKVFEMAPCDVEMHCIERIRQIVQVFSAEIDKVVAQVSLDLDL